jgi:hypothetical protein
MVAQISRETFNTSRTPQWEASDSDDLVLALETARALEAQGDLREAARWLRRAAEQAEQDGNDERVLALARAAADLTNTIASSPAPPASSPRPANVTERGSIRAPEPKPAASLRPTPPPLPTPVPRSLSPRPSGAPAGSARVSSPPPVPTRVPVPRSASASSTAPRATPAPATPARTATPPPSRGPSRPAASAGATIGNVSTGEKTLTERTQRVATVRVAIPTSARDASVFVVRRLAKGQPLPPGTTEATLVLADESPLLP